MFLILLVALALDSCQQNSITDRNREAIDFRIRSYLENPENMFDLYNYTPVSSSVPTSVESTDSTMPPNTSMIVIHRYKGQNNASRWVEREAEFYFDSTMQVIGYKNTTYFNPMTKDSLKARSRLE